jgi:hypothetical protein
MRHFIEAYDTRQFFTEEYSFQIPERTFAAALEVMPNHCSYFRFYDLVDGPLPDAVPTPEGVSVQYRYERLNVSGPVYPGGTLFNADDIRQMNADGRYDILLSNMECNGWARVVRHRGGGFQPYSLDAMVV